MRPTISEIKSSTALNIDSTMSRKQISYLISRNFKNYFSESAIQYTYSTSAVY